ncbi:MAG TPA: hypothetical protein VKZ61_02160 [Thermomicrobiales bacterium]|nr:hypothetical protein [Thermomicrobiales bacterium]
MSATGRRNPVPESLRQAAMWFTLAVIAGIAESAISVVDGVFLETGTYSSGEIIANVALRVVVYGSVLVIIRYLRQGHRWSSHALTLVLGVLGMGSLVVPYLLWLGDGNSVIAGIKGLDAVGALFAGVRVAHVVFVLLGLLSLYAGPSRRYYRRESVASS